MESKSLFMQRKIIFLVILLFLAGFLSRMGMCLAAEQGPVRSVQQIETTVIHVDQYAIYAPNLIFYYDTQMEKRKVASMMKAADQLRNKKAVITYSSTGDPGQDKHILLLDIIPAGEKVNAEKTPRETPKPSGDSQGKPEKNISKTEVQPKDAETADQQEATKQIAQQEKKPAKTAGSSTPVTREELTAFIRQILELNGKKDLTSVAPFYADKVDYYDRGVVSRDYVIRDLGYYFHNWENITTLLEGDVVMIVLDQPEVRIAKFISSYSVRNEKKTLTGKTENIWKIQRINGQLKLIDVKQRVVAKESPAQ
jgi:hypothetical protein